MAAPQPSLWKPALAGAHFSCVPQPSSAGCMPSERKPSIDQVLTNTLRGFGFLARCVALGDVHALDAEALGETAPFLARRRLDALLAVIGGEIYERLLDEPG